MHEYAEKMGLIHESKGDKERVLFLKKKEIEAVKNNNEDDIKIEEIEQEKKDYSLADPLNSINFSVQNNNNTSSKQVIQQNKPIETTKINEPKKETKNSSNAKNSNEKKDDWDDVEDLLNSLEDSKKKGKCSVPSCFIDSKDDKVECTYCHKWFCEIHKNNWVHVCDSDTKYQNFESNQTKLQKNKVSSKAKELQDGRKPKPKKK